MLIGFVRQRSLNSILRANHDFRDNPAERDSGGSPGRPNPNGTRNHDAKRDNGRIGSFG